MFSITNPFPALIRLCQKMYQGSPDEPANVDEVENLRNELTRLNTALEVVKQRLAGMAATNDLSISTADPMQTDGELTSQQLKDLEAELLGGIQKQLESERMWEEERGCGEQSQPRTVRELKESVRGMSEELERLLLMLKKPIPRDHVAETVSNAP